MTNMNPYHDEFSQAELEPEGYEPVASSFFGLRAWTVDDGSLRKSKADDPPAPAGIPFNGAVLNAAREGALRSIFRSQYIWGQGINTAECLRGGLWTGMTHGTVHEPVWAECDCGFWAYTAGSHVMSIRGPSVTGIIQGWGRMVIGPHGFRAQRARIVALCLNQPVPDPEPEPEGTSVGSLLSSAVKLLTPQPRPMCPSPWAAPPDLSNQTGHYCPPDLARTVRKLYPRVPVYESNDAMQRAWPLSDLSPLLPPPEDPPTIEDEVAPI